MCYIANMTIAIVMILYFNIDAMASVGNEITESLIFKALQGEDQENSTQNLNNNSSDTPLISFMISFSRDTFNIDKNSYQKLTILSNIINNEKLQDKKFLIVCCYDIIEKNHIEISGKLTKAIQAFMIKQISDNQEKVMVRTAEERPSKLQPKITTGAGTGRLEFFRVE